MTEKPELVWVPRGYYSDVKIKDDDVQMMIRPEGYTWIKRDYAEDFDRLQMDINHLEKYGKENETKLRNTRQKLHLLRHLVADYLPQIGMTAHFREMFYQIVGEPYPDWFEIPEPDVYERQWREEILEGKEHG